MDNKANDHQLALARNEGVVVQELPDEVLVYDLKRHKAHCLNKTAAFIWQHCDGQTTAAEIATLLQQETGAPVSEEIIWYALSGLGQANLLDKKLKPPVSGRVSRRDVLQKLGQGALLAIPVIASLSAPAFGQAASTVTAPNKIPNGQCMNSPGCLGQCCTSNALLCTATGCNGSPCVSNNTLQQC